MREPSVTILVLWSRPDRSELPQMTGFPLRMVDCVASEENLQTSIQAHVNAIEWLLQRGCDVTWRTERA